MKTCKRCGKEKPLTEFHKQKGSKDGHRTYCKECRGRAAWEANQIKKRKCVVCKEMKMRSEFIYQSSTCKVCYPIKALCYKCNTVKLLDDFGVTTQQANGHFSYCKECRRTDRECVVCGEFKTSEHYLMGNKTCNECLPFKARCSDCNEVKPLDDFYSDNRKNNGKQNRCKKCFNYNSQARRYGLTTDELTQLFKDVDNKCPICSATKNLVVDHDHNLPKGHPNYVRSILCSQCNTSIGLMKENPEALRKAANYLERFGR